jgi:tetratricopeptide (TPR) repeat protein
MSHQNANAKFGVKPLIVLIIFMAAFGTSFWAARQIRDNALLEKALAEGLTAYEKEDWQEASKSFRKYLRRNPNDIAILRKYAKALMSVRPLDTSAIAGAISSYRQIVQLDPQDEAACEMFVALYTGLSNFNELVSVAEARIEHDPNDR